MDKKYYFLLILFFIISNSFLVYPQSSENSEVDFNHAVKLFDSGDYNGALKTFDLIAGQNSNPDKEISLLFKGKCLLRINNFDEADSTLLKFIDLYPTSNYVDEARLTLSKLYYKEKDYFDSFKELVNLITASNSEFYINYAKATGEKIAENFLISPDIKKIYNSVSESKSKPYLLLILSKLSVTEGNLKAASQYLMLLVNKYPNSDEQGEASLLKQKIDSDLLTVQPNTIISSPLIGVMLPLSGDKVTSGAASAANEILEGIKYAVSEYNSSHEDEKIGLVIENTKLDKSKIDSIKIEFQNIPSLRAVIGPIFSNEVRIAINDFQDTDIPIISPTATDSGLTSKNDNFFQANPPFSLRGEVMADYVYRVENKERLAVLYSTDGYSPLLASTFMNEFNKIGGEIFASGSYESNSFSLNEPVSQIAAYQDTLQGIYIPLADKIDVPAIFSQLVQQDTLGTRIFGNQDWFYAKGFESAPAFSENLTFTSDYFINYNDSNFIHFSRNFFNTTNIDPNRNVLYGYDTAKYLLDIIDKSGNSRYAVKRKMESGITIKGFHNNISFNKDHINKYLNIVRYKNGRFQLVEKFQASN
jgi:ABC-type branched-subunit amino acid transport system substrate-binding protein/outer membrane protein assembly factor BamD (BamD/ComL family)